MTTKYDSLGRFLEEAKTDGPYFEEDAGTEGQPEWIIDQTLSLIADVKVLAEALTKLTEAYQAAASASTGVFYPEDHPAWSAARAALKRIQGEAG